jgi:hypothetical protein
MLLGKTLSSVSWSTRDITKEISIKINREAAIEGAEFGAGPYLATCSFER